MKAVRINAQAKMIDIPDLVNGLYIVRAVALDGTATSTRIVVHR